MEVDAPESPEHSPRHVSSKRSLSPDIELETPAASPSKPQRSHASASHTPHSAKRQRTNAEPQAAESFRSISSASRHNPPSGSTAVGSLSGTWEEIWRQKKRACQSNLTPDNKGTFTDVPNPVSSSTRSRTRGVDSPVSSSQRSSTHSTTGRGLTPPSSITSMSTSSPVLSKGKGKAKDFSHLHSTMPVDQLDGHMLRKLPSQNYTPASRRSR